jgi:prophage regulatory protein
MAQDFYRHQIVRERQRAAITGLSRATWWRMEKAGEAPRRVKLGARAVGWVRGELEDWISQRSGREID